MSDRTVVYFREEVEGFHRWPDAPDEVAFLRNEHRHIFGVRVDVRVSHDDRDVEFIIGRRALGLYLSQIPPSGTESCEMIARRVRNYFAEVHGWTVVRVEVDEDGENGAYIEWSEA